MSFLQISNVAIRGIATCVPKNLEKNLTSKVFESTEVAQKFIMSTGVEERRIASSDLTASDLCCQSAEQLIDTLKWNKNEIDCLVFVSQTPDYILPATSCILQSRLGLPSTCFTLDISLGCSGWVYALSVISSLLSHGGIKKGLLLAGDTISKLASDKDKSTYPLFGDAGTATALEYTTSASTMDFHFSTDGEGYETIIVPDGAARNSARLNSFFPKTFEGNIVRNRLQLSLDGMDVFSFGISKAPQSVNELLDYYNIDKNEIDYYLFHQANLFMNEKIRKKLGLDKEKVPYSLPNFGNTSCATIPLTMATQLQDALTRDKLSIIGCGFGVGLSWGSVRFETNKIVCSDLIEI